MAVLPVALRGPGPQFPSPEQWKETSGKPLCYVSAKVIGHSGCRGTQERMIAGTGLTLEQDGGIWV